jgi:hypothetical protein
MRTLPPHLAMNGHAFLPPMGTRMSPPLEGGQQSGTRGGRRWIVANSYPPSYTGRAQQQVLCGLCVSRSRTNKGGTSRGRYNCIRASVFRRSCQNEPIIDLINARGTQTCAVQGRRMDITSYESVLAALENCASRFSRQGKIQGADDNLRASWALGETGMVNISLFCNSYENN